MLTKELQSMRNNLEHLNEEHASRAAVAQGKKLDKDLNVEEAPAKAPKKAKAACKTKAPKAPQKAKAAKEAK
jgi:hypothetical protein